MAELIKKVPTLDELMSDEAIAKREKDNALLFLLNQEPPAKWVKEHPTAKVKKNGIDVPVRYLPIERVYFLLHRIYGVYSVEIKDVKLIANSVAVTVTVSVTNPVTQTKETHDGIGAVPLQTDKGAGAIEFDKIKSVAVMIGAPAAESFAIKDACEKWGKIFGRDLNVSDVDYAGFVKDKEPEPTERVKVVEGSPQWVMLIRDLVNGVSINDIEEKVDLSPEQREKLLSEAI